jgi:uncharacterized SAM-binding protein YcdF (DUF218 family)
VIVIEWAKETLRLGSITAVLILLGIGVVLLFARPAWGRRWIVAVTLGLWFVSTPLGSGLLSAPLIRNFHAIEDAHEAGPVGAIVVLGGGIRYLKVRSDALAYPYDSTTLRVLEGARLFRLLGTRPLVVASGGITTFGSRASEGTVIAEGLARLGVPQDRIVLEEKSRTTRDQAINVTRMLAARGVHRFALVTSPTHMLRASAAFRAQHADVVPSITALGPDARRKRRFFVPNQDSLDISDAAVYDYAGTVYYWARGWFQPDAAGAPR